MKPVRLWIGLVFLTIGVFGVLDATGALDSGTTIDHWWPVAIIGLGLLAMYGQRRVAFGPLLVTAVGVELREAHIDGEATVDAFALFGGVDILVPKDWRVSLSGTPILGGYEDKTTGNG